MKYEILYATYEMKPLRNLLITRVGNAERPEKAKGPEKQYEVRELKKVENLGDEITNK